MNKCIDEIYIYIYIYGFGLWIRGMGAFGVGGLGLRGMLMC